MTGAQKVMLDRTLAELYGVETKQLKRAVRRNIHRFPSDFMLELTKAEYDSIRFQFGTLKRGEHSKYLRLAFTEQGDAMLCSVLTSRRAIEVNIDEFVKSPRSSFRSWFDTSPRTENQILTVYPIRSP